MKRVILVGNGLAGTVLAFQLNKAGFEVTMIGDQNLSACSRVAAGIWNPLVFKRMTLSWKANQLIPELLDFYRSCEKITGRNFLNLRQSIRAFTEDQEKELWQRRARNELAEFTEDRIYAGQADGFENCRIPNGYAKILQTGNLDIPVFLDAGKMYFKQNYVEEKFEFAELCLLPNGVKYKHLEADMIVFCEGYLVKNNPYFNWIPLKPAKGEVLHVRIQSPGFRNGIFHRNGFLIDLQEGLYLAGATYNWEEQNDDISTGGRQELEQKLKTMLNCDYQVERHLAGVRPSSIDRRPVLGVHPRHKQLFVFNGLGTKGVMLAPWLALKFVHFLQQSVELPREVKLERFNYLYKHENT